MTMPARPPAPYASEPRRTPSPRPAPRSQAKSRLRVIEAPAPRRSIVPFALLCMAIFAAALLTVLVLNTSMASASFEKAELQTEIGRIDQDTQGLQVQLESKRASLPDQALKLGMVQSSDPVTLRLDTGQLAGVPGQE